MDLVGLWRWSKSVRYFGRPVCKALKVSAWGFRYGLILVFKYMWLHTAINSADLLREIIQLTQPVQLNVSNNRTSNDIICAFTDQESSKNIHDRQIIIDRN